MLFSLKADKLTPLNLKSPPKSAIYLAPENAGLDASLGHLFILAEISSKEKRVPEILEQTLKELSEYYYHSPTKNAEAALETTCQYFNENIADISGKDLKWIREKFNLLIGTIQADNLILSYFGQLKAWLLRQNKLHDITAGQSGPKKNPGSKKLLNQLISGRLEQNDTLLLANGVIFDYFSHDKIKKTIGALQPSQACAYFKNTLLDYQTPIDFNAVIIKFDQVKSNISPCPEPAAIISQAGRHHQLDFQPQKLKLSFIADFAKKVGSNLQAVTSKLVELIRPKPVKTAGKQLPVVNVEINPPESASPSVLSGNLWIKSAAGLAKHRLKIAIGLLAVVFMASLFLVNQKKQQQQEIVNFEQAIADINEKINSSEAALIYKDENKAQELLAEAKSLANSLPSDTAEQIYEQQQLLSGINQQINRIYHIETISNPTQIANLAGIKQISSNLALIKNNLYLAAGGAVYKINPVSAETAKMADVSGAIIKIIPFESNTLLLAASDNQFYLFNASNNSSRLLNFSLPQTDSSMIDFNIYAQKLYLLNSQDNNIYKYTYNTSGFGQPTKWLSEPLDLTGYKSLAVDGNIWLGTKQGEISKLFKGKPEIFKLTGLLDPITDDTIIVTADYLTNLYLLDETNQKIVIAAKSGKVIKTLLMPENIKVNSLIPTADEKGLYLLTEEAVYKTNI